MILASPLDSASSWLNWSNALYVAGAALTVISATYILYESRAVALGLRPKRYLLTEIAVLVAAFIALVGTSGAVHFGDFEQAKDADLKAYPEAS